MNEMDEIKITETVYKQSVALRGIQNTNKQTKTGPSPPTSPSPPPPTHIQTVHLTFSKT